MRRHDTPLESAACRRPLLYASAGMATVESLPPDQRAVLQLVLQRGRSYDDIATLLSIDRAAVRQRALAALDALGPQTRLAPERRALITDYLLGQLPGPLCDDTRSSLAGSAGERAWARVLASELAPLADHGLPEIPAEDSGRRSEPAATPTVTVAAAVEASGGGGKPSSRIGGAVLLGIGALIAVIVVVIVIASNSGSSSTTTSSAAATPTTASTPAAATTTTPTPVAQINLSSPTGATSPTGIADVLKQGTARGIAIRAQGMTPNTKHDAYAVWLYKSATQAKILGFVNPSVGSNGNLGTEGPLPADAANYSQLLVTLETQASPKAPGKIVLRGNLTLG